MFLANSAIVALVAGAVATLIALLSAYVIARFEFRGKGTVLGAFTGILLLYTIQNVLTLGGVPPQWIDALNGGIILVALIVSRVTTGQAQE